MSEAPAPPPVAAPIVDRGEGLLRALGRWTMTALMINMIVGSGIFGLPSRIHGQAGSWDQTAYLACAVVIAAIALCLAEVASRFRDTGGPYLYARESLGPLPGFLVGWLMLLTRMTSLAIIAGVMVDYLSWFWPAAANAPIHAVVAASAIAALAVINWIGVRQGAGVASALTIAKLIPLFFFVVVGAFFVDPRRFGGVPPASGGVTPAVLQLVFAFGGFEAAIVTAGEMKDPPRDAPFALLMGIGATAVLYLAIQAVCVGTLPELSTSTRPLADAAQRFAGVAGGSVLAVGAFVSTLGTLGGTLLAAPRLLFAMSEAGQMPRLFARLDPRFHTPAAAILAVALGGMLLSVTGTFTYLVRLNVLTRLVQYLATALAVLVLRRRTGRAAPFVVRGAWIVVPFTVAACAWLMITSSPREQRDLGIALALGLVVYGAGRAWRASPPAPRSSVASRP